MEVGRNIPTIDDDLPCYKILATQRTEYNPHNEINLPHLRESRTEVTSYQSDVRSFDKAQRHIWMKIDFKLLSGCQR